MAQVGTKKGAHLDFMAVARAAAKTRVRLLVKHAANKVLRRG
jgi:hypothetical protein